MKWGTTSGVWAGIHHWLIDGFSARSWRTTFHLTIQWVTRYQVKLTFQKVIYDWLGGVLHPISARYRPFYGHMIDYLRLFVMELKTGDIWYEIHTKNLRMQIRPDLACSQKCFFALMCLVFFYFCRVKGRAVEVSFGPKTFWWQQSPVLSMANTYIAI